MALDAKSLAVTEFLTALKACEDILRELASKLRLRPGVVSTGSAGPRLLENVPYEIRRTNGTIEHFQAGVQYLITVTLRSKREGEWRASEWLVEIYWNKVHWLVETSMNVDNDMLPYYGPLPLRYFPERYADTLDELIVQTQAAVEELVASIDAIDEAIAMGKALV